MSIVVLTRLGFDAEEVDGGRGQHPWSRLLYRTLRGAPDGARGPVTDGSRGRVLVRKEEYPRTGKEKGRDGTVSVRRDLTLVVSERTESERRS